VSRDLDGYTRHMLGHRVRMVLGDWAGAVAAADETVPPLTIRGPIRSRRDEPDTDADLARKA
jgi:hypothetical protein